MESWAKKFEPVKNALVKREYQNAFSSLIVFESELLGELRVLHELATEVRAAIMSESGLKSSFGVNIPKLIQLEKHKTDEDQKKQLRRETVESLANLIEKAEKIEVVCETITGRKSTINLAEELRKLQAQLMIYEEPVTLEGGKTFGAYENLKAISLHAQEIMVGLNQTLMPMADYVHTIIYTVVYLKTLLGRIINEIKIINELKLGQTPDEKSIKEILELLPDMERKTQVLDSYLRELSKEEAQAEPPQQSIWQKFRHWTGF